MTLEELRAECLFCNKCALSAGRTKVVFGDGNPDADILFVGEGPGQNEDETGLPFVGRAGKLLDDYLTAVGLLPRRRLHHQYRQMPAAAEPGPAARGAGRLHRLSADPVPADFLRN